jgi:hypothetical protein
VAEEELCGKAIDRFFTEDIIVVLPKALKEEAATRLIEGEESGKPE